MLRHVGNRRGIPDQGLRAGPCHDRVARALCDDPALRCLHRVDGRCELQADGERAGCGDRHHALAKAHVAIVGGSQAAAAVAMVVADRQRHDRAPRGDRGLQQGGVEVLHMAAVGRGALREECDHLAGIHECGDLCIDDARVPAAASTQEHRVVAACQPADAGPVANFGLRDESRWKQRIDGEDVDPGNVIRDDQARPGELAWVALQRDAQIAEQLARPAPPALATGTVVEPGEDQRDARQARDKVQGESKKPPVLQRLRCLLRGGRGSQSLRPMKCLAYLPSTLFIAIMMGRSAVLKSGSQAGSPQIQAPARR